MKRFQGVSDDVKQNLRRDVVQGEACGEKQSRSVFEVATDEVSRVAVTLKVSETQRKKKYWYEVSRDSWFSDAESDGNGESQWYGMAWINFERHDTLLPPSLPCSTLHQPPNPNPKIILASSPSPRENSKSKKMPKRRIWIGFEKYVVV